MTTIKAKLLEGKPIVGQWLSIASPALTELIANIGMDWLLIDTEHSAASWETVEDMVRSMKGTEVVPLIRVGDNDPALIKQALDRGASGVVVPMVNTAEEAARAVEFAKYPPAGSRGVAATRASGYGRNLEEYYSKWNEESIVVIQIETSEALQNIDEIAAVHGVDVLFLGPVDLSANIGVFLDFEHPSFIEATSRVLEAAENHGKAAGYMAMNASAAIEKIEEGFKFIALGTEARVINLAVGNLFSTVIGEIRNQPK